jgi:hypothetical protein
VLATLPKQSVCLLGSQVALRFLLDAVSGCICQNFKKKINLFKKDADGGQSIHQLAVFHPFYSSIEVLQSLQN